MVAIKVPTEHEEQKSLIRWFSLQYPKIGNRLVAVPNGGQRNVIVASKLKAEGVRAGFPDLMLLMPRGEFMGLMIEMKRVKGGSLQAEQAEWLDWLNKQGYMAVICKGAQAAQDTIKSYLRADR
ncbi:VRR-NUC domain-containing protein [Pseudomonas sp. CCC3.2]|uniref:VRR-NUC domain-containing protein n=1 Tax=unclassified Pseudomonas TaxID=196821 RepID=UPI002AB45C05|nr:MULTISPECIES: VRR-NUC domain-containing protein [unclassified Pseudomonas]MDY7559943.1 VRR-NUC domain-containing protein [Pseudomonas sp. AB6]MEB0179417.1 VRR-NUC domain-containing protein [Pseudomonas sp. CCC3.2]MEB0210483.1 VRR-NUC domain-containing protein [Pseudomonas sp. AB6]